MYLVALMCFCGVAIAQNAPSVLESPTKQSVPQAAPVAPPSPKDDFLKTVPVYAYGNDLDWTTELLNKKLKDEGLDVGNVYKAILASEKFKHFASLVESYYPNSQKVRALVSSNGFLEFWKKAEFIIEEEQLKKIQLDLNIKGDKSLQTPLEELLFDASNKELRKTFIELLTMN